MHIKITICKDHEKTEQEKALDLKTKYEAQLLCNLMSAMSLKDDKSVPVSIFLVMVWYFLVAITVVLCISN